MAAGSVSGWGDDRWLAEAERAWNAVKARAETEGVPFRSAVDAGALRKHAAHLDARRYRGAATDDQKRDLLVSAAVQRIYGFERDDCGRARERLRDLVESAVDGAKLKRGEALEAKRRLRREVDEKLRALDHPGPADFGALEDEIRNRVDVLIARARVHVEVRRRRAGGDVSGDQARLLMEWCNRTEGTIDPNTFVETCLADEARRQATKRGVLRSDLVAALERIDELLAEWETEGRRDRASRRDPATRHDETVLGGLGLSYEGLLSSLVWHDRLGTPPPQDLEAYVRDVVRHADRRARSFGDHPPGGRAAVPDDIPDEWLPPPSDVDRAMAGLDAVFDRLRRDLFDAGGRLASYVPRPGAALRGRQGPALYQAIDVTAVTVRLLAEEADGLTTARLSAALDNRDDGADVPLLSVLGALADPPADEIATWLRPWTERAARLLGIDRGYRWDLRLATGADEYVHPLLKGGVAGFLGEALAPTIEQMRSILPAREEQANQ